MSKPTTTDPHPGELCSCGRRASIVYLTERFGRVGFCGQANAQALERCADASCQQSRPHARNWCTAAVPQ